MKRFNNMMYLRPQNLKKTFLLKEREISAVSGRGRVKEIRSKETKEIHGVLSTATVKDLNLAGQFNHVITHTIVQTGNRIAGEGDLLIRNDKLYEVKFIDPCGDLGTHTIYYVEEKDEKTDSICHKAGDMTG